MRAVLEAARPGASLEEIVARFAPPERPSLAAMGAGMGAAGLAGLSIGALRPGARGSEPVFEDPTPPAETAAEPLLPDLLPDSAPAPDRHPPVGAGAEEDLFAAPEPARHAFPEPEPVALHEATDHGSEHPSSSSQYASSAARKAAMGWVPVPGWCRPGPSAICTCATSGACSR